MKEASDPDDAEEEISQNEREHIDKLHHLKHETEEQLQTAQRLMEVESELERVRSENLKLSDIINNQKLSLEQGAKNSKAQRQKTAELATRLTVTEQELHLANSALQKRSGIDDVALHDPLNQLNETRQLRTELSGTRQRLSDVQERLTVAEQVTAATQQRALQELQESGNSDELPLELTPQHQSTTPTGAVLIF